jgi:hypothetical protein
LDELSYHAELVDRYEAWKKEKNMCDEGDGMQH